MPWEEGKNQGREGKKGEREGNSTEEKITEEGRVEGGKEKIHNGKYMYICGFLIYR